MTACCAGPGDNRQSSEKYNKYQLLFTYRCNSWWWA